MSDKKDLQVIIATGVGFCILCSVIYYTKKYFRKHVSFSINKNAIKYIPSNAEMAIHKDDLYYSASDYVMFSENTSSYDTIH